jgi:SAM-dependent methyltransferase
MWLDPLDAVILAMSPERRLKRHHRRTGEAPREARSAATSTRRVAELARVLRPGGILLTTDLHPIAVATGRQAFFTAADGSRHMALNHVHRPSQYSRALGMAGLRIDRLEETLRGRAVRQWDLGRSPQGRHPGSARLPLAIAWRGSKPRT